MSIILLGLNHKTAPVEIRERFSFTDAALQDALRRLVRGGKVSESVILATCNRTELYAHAPQSGSAPEHLRAFLAGEAAENLKSIEKYLYSYEKDEAVRHLFAVASGLDSMIVGEGQILGQVKHAHALAQGAGATGPLLNRLFDAAVRAGKRSRTETAICQGASSISYAAVELAKRIFGDLTHCRVLLVGAGKMSELAVKLLVSAGVQLVMVSNRTHDRAVEIAESYGGKAVSFEEFPRHLGEADIVISSTAAPHFILTREKTAASLKIRKGRPLFIVDIAVPRDVEPSVGNLDNVYLYNIDDLKETVSQNLDQRACEIAKVEEIIEEEARSYLDYLSERGAVPLIREMRESFESIGREELQRALSRNNLTQREQKLLETFSGSLMQKLLHRPTVKLKELASGGADQRTLDVVRDLFCSLEKDGEVRND